MNKIKSILKNNKKLFSFIGLSYFDKMVIFLLPLIVLSLFKDKTVYVNIEYIYSLVVIIVPFLDLGLSGYFFYAYRNNDSFRQVIADVVKLFHVIYLGVFVIGLFLILIHYFVFPFENHIVYIVFRSIFILTFAFLTSYYRLVNKPQKALFVTLSANFISLSFLLVFFFLGVDFNLWFIFIGQIIFCVYYFVKVLIRVISRWVKTYQPFSKLGLIKKSLLFSWPNIIQVFILMYIANYGKINALENMSIDDGVLLSLSQRFSMLIQLTHSAILGFLMKDIFVTGDLLSIKKSILFKYVFLLFSAVIAVAVIVVGYFYIFGNTYEVGFLLLNLSLIVGYTFLWCVYSYFEIYYSRENKNTIKMYLAIINGIIFITIFNMLSYDYIVRITLAMFVSTLITLLISIIILKKRNYKLV